MWRVSRFWTACLVSACLVLALGAGHSFAQARGTADEELAEKYAPYVDVKPQSGPCDGDGERFRPVPVDVVLDRPGVTLRGPDGQAVKEAPSASDLFGLGSSYYLDLPGNSIKPGCAYEEWFRTVAANVPTTVYAHVTGEAGKPGLLALQYWLYWPFNDWNNKHESDWEMIQLVFEADSAEAALRVDPVEIGYSQHEGAERAAWTDRKLEKRDGRPVVHPGTGSHANYFDEALHLGHGPSAGFGCDDTREQTDVQDPLVVLLPTQPTGPEDPFAWLAFEGRWGELHHGSYSGPTGPAVKKQWLEPISWRDDTWRNDGITLTGQEPGKGAVPLASSFFCSAVESGSKLYVDFLNSPLIIGLAVGGVAAGGLALGRRTRWRPAPPVPIDQHRRAGQMLTAAARIYADHVRLYVALGAMFLVFGGAGALLQLLLFDITPLGALVSIADRDPLIGTVAALTCGTLTTLVASVLVYAGSAWATRCIAEAQVPRPAAVYRKVLSSTPTLLMVTLRVAGMVTLLSLTVVGAPFAVVYFVRRSLANQAVMVEGLGATRGLRRSREIVKGNGLRVLLILVLTNAVVFVSGPVIGILALFIWSPSILFVNILSGLIYTLLVPYAGIVLALLFYDLRLGRNGVSAAATTTAAGSGEELAAP